MIKSLCTNEFGFEFEKLLSFVKDFTDNLTSEPETSYSEESPHRFITDQLYRKEIGPPNQTQLIRLSIEFMSSLITQMAKICSISNNGDMKTIYLTPKHNTLLIETLKNLVYTCDDVEAILETYFTLCKIYGETKQPKFKSLIMTELSLVAKPDGKFFTEKSLKCIVCLMDIGIKLNQHLDSHNWTCILSSMQKVEPTLIECLHLKEMSKS